MNAERFRRIETIFAEAADLPTGELTRYLEEACADDEQVKHDVRALIAQHDPRSTFLEPPNPASGGSARQIVGARVGRYVITRVIASGGMGTVYEAEQHRPSRRVALKVMQASLASESARRRFEFESQILGLLRHPNVAQIFEAGVYEDMGGAVPFFAMELIEGATSLTAYVARRRTEGGGDAAGDAGGDESGAGSLKGRLPEHVSGGVLRGGGPSAPPPGTREEIDTILGTFLQACAAVQHGHQQGVIHRDLKPANILVDATGVVKVIDFGVARVIRQGRDETPTLSEPGRVIGTLAYMSPEQVGQRVTDSHIGDISSLVDQRATPPGGTLSSLAGEIDIRTDVYSLGIVLYEMLCGASPYDVRSKALGDAAAIIQFQPPVRPSSLNALLRGDLETILLKALEKDRERRYQSVEAFARDIERYRRLEPIDARPPTSLYQIRLFTRRHRALVFAVGVIAAVLVIATSVSLWFAARASVKAAEAEKSRLRAQRTADYLEGALASANPWFPPVIPKNDELADYEPWDEWQHSPWPYAGMPGRAANTIDVLWAAAQRVSEEFGDDPLTRARLSDSLGWTLARMLTTETHPRQADMSILSERLLREALRIRREELGPRDEETLRTMMRLAEFLDYRPGGLAEGERLYDEAWRTCRELYGGTDPRTLHALRSWANNVAFYQQRLSDAMARMKAELGRAVEPGSNASAAELVTLAYYGYVMHYVDAAEGKRITEDAYARLTAAVGRQNVRTAYAGRYLTNILMDLGDAAGAERVSLDTHAAEAAFFGTESLEAAYRLKSHVETLIAQQKWRDAIAPAKHAMGVFNGVRGPVHWDTVNAQWTYSVALYMSGEDAAESERHALEVYDKAVALEGAAGYHTLTFALRLIDAGLDGRKLNDVLGFIVKQEEIIVSTPARHAFLGLLTTFHAECLNMMNRSIESIEVFDRVSRAAERNGASEATLGELRQRMLRHVAEVLMFEW